MTFTNHSNRLGEASFRSLCQVAWLSNALAKQLTGTERALAYQIKAEACSSLIIEGGASVNGIWPNGIIALSLLSDPPSRIHIPRSHLRPDARAAVGNQTMNARVVVRISDGFKAKVRTAEPSPRKFTHPHKRSDPA